MSNVKTYVTNPRGHVWEIEDGEIDIFAFTSGEYHNGPRCVKCGYGFCHHCEDGPEYECLAHDTRQSGR